MLSRREFICTGFGAGLGVALGAELHALPGDKFRWAMSSHMFTPLKPHPETGIKMAAKFGFHGIEPWGNELQKYLTQPPEVFKKVLDESGIGISSVASGGEYFDTDQTAGDARQQRRERQVRVVLRRHGTQGQHRPARLDRRTSAVRTARSSRRI